MTIKINCNNCGGPIHCDTQVFRLIYPLETEALHFCDRICLKEFVEGMSN